MRQKQKERKKKCHAQAGARARAVIRSRAAAIEIVRAEIGSLSVNGQQQRGATANSPYSTPPPTTPTVRVT